METVKIHLHGMDQGPVEVVLRNSTNGDGIYRETLKNIVFGKIGEGPDLKTMSEIEIAEANAPRIEAVIFYSACLACVESPHEARVLPLEQYQALPEDEKNEWTNAAFRVNEHWNKKIIEDAAKAIQDAAIKKNGTLKTGSRRHTTTPK